MTFQGNYIPSNSETQMSDSKRQGLKIGKVTARRNICQDVSESFSFFEKRFSKTSAHSSLSFNAFRSFFVSPLWWVKRFLNRYIIAGVHGTIRVSDSFPRSFRHRFYRDPGRLNRWPQIVSSVSCYIQSLFEMRSDNQIHNDSRCRKKYFTVLVFVFFVRLGLL